MVSIVEHVALYKFRDDVTISEIDSLMERVNSLVTLEEVLHLSTGPLLRIRSSSSSSSFNFTHVFHSRFNSKDDLQAYAVHPSHVEAAKANGPLVVDALVLHWVSERHGDAALVPPPGSALRFTIFKLKEGVGEQVKDEVLRAIKVTQHDEKPIQFTCGENFSSGNGAKGFSIAFLAVFPQLHLQAPDDDEFGKYDEIKGHLENILMVDYVPQEKKS